MASASSRTALPLPIFLLAAIAVIAARPTSAGRPVPTETELRELSAIASADSCRSPPPPPLAPLPHEKPTPSKSSKQKKDHPLKKTPMQDDSFPVRGLHLKNVKETARIMAATSCADATSYCATWGKRYCAPSFTYKGMSVQGYWCRKTCRTCNPPTATPKKTPPPPKKTTTTTVRALTSPPPAQHPSTPPSAVASGAEYQFQLLVLVNQGRAQNGLGPLCLNLKLNAAALAHSRDMDAKNYFAHNSLDGSKPWDRMTRAGYGFVGYEAENIAKGYRDAQTVYEGWKNSPGHWANILGPYRHMGVGMVNNIWTQDFGSNPAELCNS